MTEEDADDLILLSANRAQAAPVIELTSENWRKEFPNDRVQTPIGEVKMGDNQYQKLIDKGRQGQLGMIKPTLTDPDFIIEKPSEAKEGQETERPTSLLFIKSFIGKNGEKRYLFESVTISKDGMEVSVSNHIETPKRVRQELIKGKLLYRFDGGVQTEQTPVSASGTTSRTMPGVPDNKVSENLEDSQISVKQNEPMPFDAEGEPDWGAVTPERAHAFIFGESGYSRVTASRLSMPTS